MFKFKDRHRETEGRFVFIQYQRHTRASRADRVLFARRQQHDSDGEQARQVPRDSSDRDWGLQREPRHGRSTVLFIRLYQSASLASRQSISVGVLGGAHAKVKEVDGGHGRRVGLREQRDPVHRRDRGGGLRGDVRVGRVGRPGLARVRV